MIENYSFFWVFGSNFSVYNLFRCFFLSRIQRIPISGVYAGADEFIVGWECRKENSEFLFVFNSCFVKTIDSSIGSITFSRECVLFSRYNSRSFSHCWASTEKSICEEMNGISSYPPLNIICLFPSSASQFFSASLPLIFTVFHPHIANLHQIFLACISNRERKEREREV